METPEQIWRYAQQGRAIEVLEGLRKGRYLELRDVGVRYAEVRLQVRQLLLDGERSLSARALRALAEDSKTPEELAGVLNYITRRQLQWRDMPTADVLRWGQGRMRYLQPRQQGQQPPKRPRGGPPSPPPLAPTSTRHAQPGPRPSTPPGQSRMATWSWVAAAAGGVMALLKAASSLPFPLLVP